MHKAAQAMGGNLATWLRHLMRQITIADFPASWQEAARNPSRTAAAPRTAICSLFWHRGRGGCCLLPGEGWQHLCRKQPHLPVDLIDPVVTEQPHIPKRAHQMV